MWKWIIAGAVAWLMSAAPVPAQMQASVLPDVVAEAVTVAETTNDYGQAVQTAHGLLRNQAEVAYTHIALSAEVYDASDTLIGEGYAGVLVNACGGGLVPDHALQPGAAQSFTIPLELFEPGTVARVEISVTGELAPVTGLREFEDPAVTQVSADEVVEVEWRSPRSLRFASGCVRSLFNEWRWQTYNTLIDEVRPAEHPRAGLIDEAMRERLRLTDPLIYANSFLRFDPYGTRLVYQDSVNRFYSADEQGRFARLIHSGLNSYSLQGIYWLGDERFLAYYYGAFGDPVFYFTADAQARPISPGPLRNYESVITPGASRDGRRVVLAGNFADGEGYYLHVVTNGFFELLFLGSYPGSNYPSPLPLLNQDGERVNRVLLARDVDGVPMLQCFNRDENQLYTLAALPLHLEAGERAQWWLSPDDGTIALVADGAYGGLWLIDRAQLPACDADASAGADPSATPQAESTAVGG